MRKRFYEFRDLLITAIKDRFHDRLNQLENIVANDMINHNCRTSYAFLLRISILKNLNQLLILPSIINKSLSTMQPSKQVDWRIQSKTSVFTKDDNNFTI